MIYLRHKKTFTQKKNVFNSDSISEMFSDTSERITIICTTYYNYGPLYLANILLNNQLYLAVQQTDTNRPIINCAHYIIFQAFRFILS